MGTTVIGYSMRTMWLYGCSYTDSFQRPNCWSESFSAPHILLIPRWNDQKVCFHSHCDTYFTSSIHLSNILDTFMETSDHRQKIVPLRGNTALSSTWCIFHTRGDEVMKYNERNVSPEGCKQTWRTGGEQLLCHKCSFLCVCVWERENRNTNLSARMDCEWGCVFCNNKYVYRFTLCV